MEKPASHLRQVAMPGQRRPAAEEARAANAKPDVFGTDFGFSKVVNKQQAAHSSLDDAYGFWDKNQSPQNLSQLLTSAKPVLHQAITSFAGGDKAYMGRARKLAVDAFRTFDPTRGAKLRTHLLIRLQPLQRSYTKRTSALSVPERVQLDRYRLEQAEQAMKAELGREPADSELADRTGLALKRIAHVRGFARGTLSEGQLTTPDSGLRLPNASQVTPDDVWVEFVHHDLGPIDQKIMEWKLGIYGKKQHSTNEVARRLGITPSAVSQRAARIAAKLEQGNGA